MLREEVNAAVYASEQRIGERLDQMTERLTGVEGRLTGVEERLSRAEVIKKQMAANLGQLSMVLDEATVKINELQMSQIALEQKVEENTGTLKRDMQRLTYTVRGFMDNVTDAIAGITVRLDMHKDTPIDEAHPHSAS